MAQIRLSTAIAYDPGDFDAGSQKLVGRKAAAEGFLRAYIRYGSFDRVLCYTASSAKARHFADYVKSHAARPLECQQINPVHQTLLAQAGTLFRPDPMISRFAWQRYAPAAYSLCGITYTLAIREVYEAIADVWTAPVQPWDAIVCASSAGKQLVERVLDESARYLSERMQAQPQPGPMLPVIPLGTDTAAFPDGEKREQLRAELRSRLGVGADEPVVLAPGRINTFTKANPVPMLLGFEQCALQLGAPLQVIFAGWFECDEDEQAFQLAVREFAPHIRASVSKRPSASDLNGLYAAADIFVSLPDNIQETFGLTPIEAMSAGLPVVAADWDGYRETVRHDADGLLVPTVMAAEGTAADLAAAYHCGSINYPTYVGNASLAVSVDIDAFSRSLSALLDNRELRLALGESGRKRARENYDWKTIIPQYEALWSEMSERRRATGAKLKSIRSTAFRCPDPTAAFSHYPSDVLGDDESLVVPESTAIELSNVLSNPLSGFGAEARVAPEVMQHWLELARTDGGISIRTLLSEALPEDAPRVRRSIHYLIKFGLLRCV